MSEQERDYFLPGEYIGDMHYGTAHIIDKIRERLGVVQYMEFKQVQFELHSEGQRAGLEEFLNETRKLSYPDGWYTNKMVIAVDETTAMYMYDGKYAGIITF